MSGQRTELHLYIAGRWRNMAFFRRSTFCILTGGSRGLGREMALQMSQEWSKQGAQCDLVLISRNMQGMEETKSLISTSAPDVGVHLVQGDLSKLDTLTAIFTAAIKHADPDKHNQFVLLHNSGTTGDMTRPMIEQTDPQVIQDYMALNFTSMYILTGLFLTQFKTGHRMVINHTSTLAFRFRQCFSLYSSAKAARNALMGVLAVENPDVRILSYSPGAVDTDMMRSIVSTSYSEQTAGLFRQRYEDKKILSTSETVAKFVKILSEDKFENGANIDFHAYP